MITLAKQQTDKLLDLPSWLLTVVVFAILAASIAVLFWAFRSGRSAKVPFMEIGQDPPPPAPKVEHDLADPTGTLVTRETTGDSDQHRSLAKWHTYALVDSQELIGVDDLIAELAAIIATKSQPSAITVSGSGGLGKTAVTYAAVERVAAQGHFTHIAWASAKNTRFSAKTASAASVNSINWHDVLGMIAEQIDCVLSPTQALWEQELQEHLGRNLGDARLLIVVDNLEVLEAADHVIDRLREIGLRRPHKIVATTRWATRVDLEVKDVVVSPLEPRKSYDLVRLVARGTDSDLANATDRQLRPIHAITEGNPFLIKLIARLYLVTGRSLSLIIDELTSISNEMGMHVNNWLFDQSLNELKARSSQSEAVRLLYSFCMSGRGGALSYEELQRESRIVDSRRFAAVLEAACGLSLVRPSSQNQQYSIHSLLYEYTCPLAFSSRNTSQ